MGKNRQLSVLVLAVLILAAMACGRSSGTTGGGLAEPEADTTVQNEERNGVQEQYPAEAILFWDDFQDGDSEGWQTSSAWMVQQDGDLYTFNASEEGFAWVPAGSNWQDYAFKAAFFHQDGVLAFSFNISADGRYLVVFHDSAVSLVKELHSGERETLAQAQAPDIVRWHWFAAAVKSGHIQVYLDQALWLEAYDDDPLPAGTIGIGTSEEATGVVDNVLVNRVLQNLPTETLQSEPLDAAAEVPELVGPSVEELADAEGEDGQIPEENVPPQMPSATIRFTVEGEEEVTIDSGLCVTTSWTVENALGVYYQNEPVPVSGFSDECPFQTTTYVLEAAQVDGTYLEETVTVYVNEDDLFAEQPEEEQEELDAEENPEEESVQELADLVLAGVGLQSPPFYVGQSILVSVTMTNEGSVEARSFTVRWYPDEGQVVGCSWDTGLGAGQSRTLTCNYTYADPLAHTWRGHVDAEEEIEESSEANNKRSGIVAISEDMFSAQEIPVPPPPENCMGAAAGSDAVQISWEPGSSFNFDGYYIYLNGELAETVSRHVTSIMIDGLQPDTEYLADIVWFFEEVESPHGACIVTVQTEMP